MIAESETRGISFVIQQIPFSAVLINWQVHVWKYNEKEICSLCGSSGFVVIYKSKSTSMSFSLAFWHTIYYTNFWIKEKASHKYSLIYLKQKSTNHTQLNTAQKFLSAPATATLAPIYNCRDQVRVEFSQWNFKEYSLSFSLILRQTFIYRLHKKKKNEC